MAADAGELNAKLVRDLVARRNVVEHQGGQGVAILFELHRDAAGRCVAIVGNRDAHPHFDAGGTDAGLGHERLDGQVGPGFANAAHQMNLGDVFFFFQVGEQLANFGGAGELAGAKIAHEINDQRLLALRPAASRGIALSASAGPTSVCDGSQPARSDSSLLRNVSLICSAKTFGCAPAESRGGFGEPQQRDELRIGLLGRLVDDGLDGPLALVERRRFVPAIAHRVAVVEQHEMVRRAAAEQAEPFVAQHEVGEHQHEHGDDGHSRREQQQLLEQNPAPVAALAFQQELHRGPADALLPAQIDQMDQNGHGDQRQADREQGGKRKDMIGGQASA